MALADYQTLVTQLVRDDSGKIAAADRDGAIELARLRYSVDRPQTKVEDVLAAGGNLLDLPAGWQADFSALKSLEYPIGDVPPTTIPGDEVAIYTTPTGIKLMLEAALPAAVSVRAAYTIKQQLDAGGDTIPVQDREAVAAYAAALLLDQLAAYFTGESASTMQADTVDHATKGQEFAARARALRQRYFDHLGVDTRRNAAAGATAQLPRRDSLGWPRLTH